jgi:predicted DNA binding CopG/RHH family protein
MKINKEKLDPFKNLALDDYEKGIEEAFEKGEFVEDPNFKENKKMFEEMARRHIELRKTKRITLRVKNEDLLKVKVKAEKSQIPYQTLLNALIHKFAEGETSINI